MKYFLYKHYIYCLQLRLNIFLCYILIYLDVDTIKMLSYGQHGVTRLWIWFRLFGIMLHRKGNVYKW